MDIPHALIKTPFTITINRHNHYISINTPTAVRSMRTWKAQFKQNNQFTAFSIPKQESPQQWLKLFKGNVGLSQTNWETGPQFWACSCKTSPK